MKVRIKLGAWGHYSKNQSGFSLIEMIAAITILAVMGIFTTQFITSATQSASLTIGQKGLVDDSKLAMEYMIREIRVSTSTTGVQISPNSPTQVTITFDKFVGYTVDTNTTSIVYDWTSASQTLTRTSGGTTTTLATQISLFTATESSDFYVFTMTLQGANGENFTLDSGVRPRSSTI